MTETNRDHRCHPCKLGEHGSCSKDGTVACGCKHDSHFPGGRVHPEPLFDPDTATLCVWRIEGGHAVWELTDGTEIIDPSLDEIAALLPEGMVVSEDGLSIAFVDA